MNRSYHDTQFQVLPGELPPEFCIVTAWNPGGRADLPGKNRKRDESLASRLDELSLSRTRITGISPEGTHAEPGWAVACTLEQALDVAREFSQEAIFQVIGGDLALAYTKTGQRLWFGPFAPRIRDPRCQRSFVVHVGARSPGARFEATEKLEIRLRAAKRFRAFTIQEAERHFNSRSEDAFLIRIATNQPEEVLGLAKDLLLLLNQEGVGISHNGIYQRVTAWSDPDFLLQVWGIKASPRQCPTP